MEADSTYLKSFAYDPETQSLDVTFQDGARWRYHGVTPIAHNALVAARSKGRLFRSLIRDASRAERIK